MMLAAESRSEHIPVEGAQERIPLAVRQIRSSRGRIGPASVLNGSPPLPRMQGSNVERFVIGATHDRLRVMIWKLANSL